MQSESHSPGKRKSDREKGVHNLSLWLMSDEHINIKFFKPLSVLLELGSIC